MQIAKQQTTSQVMAVPDMDAGNLRLDVGNAPVDAQAKLECVLSVPDIRCGGCLRTIEESLQQVHGITHVRVNLSTRRLTASWDETLTVSDVMDQLSAIGYASHPVDSPEAARAPQGVTLGYLLRALAVAGFAAGNIMLFSVSVWSGAQGDTLQLFHVLSAMIAIPTVTYSGQVFFQSAWQALRKRRTNMDVPISIGILMALGLSIYDTFIAKSASDVYFEAPVMLIFFLLIGRTLDYMMRERVRSAVDGLKNREPVGAWLRQQDGTKSYHPLAEIQVGDCLHIASNSQVPLDCRVIEGESEIDTSLISGESVPRLYQPGDQLLAGTSNLTADLIVRVTASRAESYLSRMVQLMQSVEATRGQHSKIADKVSAWYAPFVHLSALLTFLAWYGLNGEVHQAVSVAISVLIITCPCAVGLAIPMVQVVVARKLFEAGILVKDGSSLERLAQIDTVVFDKTGTLTIGSPELVNRLEIADRAFTVAARMAQQSNHPFSQALTRAFMSEPSTSLTRSLDAQIRGVDEIAGRGLEASAAGVRYRLGRRSWALGADAVHSDCAPNLSGNVESVQSQPDGSRSALSETVLSADGRELAIFLFEDTLRIDAGLTVNALREHGLMVQLLSGDNEAIVRQCADTLGVATFSSGMLPDEKVACIQALSEAGHKVLMVGDGLNDAPALTAAHVSMVPGNAVDVGRSAADMIFTRNTLMSVFSAYELSLHAKRQIRNNLVFALGYNIVALPVAMMGLITPLIAALAMSASSIVVMANSLVLSKEDIFKNLSSAKPKFAPVANE